MKGSWLYPVLLALVAACVAADAQTTTDVPTSLPDAVIDLRTDDGVRLVNGQWRYRDARIVNVAHHAPGADLKPSGAPNQTQDIQPKAGARDFDDSAWEAIAAPSVEDRRGNGRLSFNWYRIQLTIPEHIGKYEVAGSTAVFEVVIDDYAEVWVDGRLPVVLGQTGGALIKGFNAPNRVVIGRNVRPGQQIQLAVFGANGPLSNPPGNFIWIRSATLEFYKAGRIGNSQVVQTRIDRRDPSLDAIIPAGAKIEKLATGFQFVEGPVWDREGEYLLFSDPNDNKIYRWTPDGEVSVFRTKSGYSGADIAEYHQPGSNGLTFDKEGRLTINEHGNRRVTLVGARGNITVVADRYQGKRLNSPNDLIYRSDGKLYFTDPAFGLPKVYDDPRKELPFQGVYMVADGKVTLLTKEFKGPNGIAFSPDEKFLYVGDWDETAKIVKRFPVNPDGTIGPGTIFADLTREPGEDAIDGIKVDLQGNVYISGPGGLWVYSADARQLGVIDGPEHPHNMAWGDDDGKTLYLGARSSLYRIRLNVPGVRP